MKALWHAGWRPVSGCRVCCQGGIFASFRLEWYSLPGVPRLLFELVCSPGLTVCSIRSYLRNHWDWQEGTVRTQVRNAERSSSWSRTSACSLGLFTLSFVYCVWSKDGAHLPIPTMLEPFWEDRPADAPKLLGTLKTCIINVMSTGCCVYVVKHWLLLLKPVLRCMLTKI